LEGKITVTAVEIIVYCVEGDVRERPGTVGEGNVQSLPQRPVDTMATWA
jgi:hypothetical protein